MLDQDGSAHFAQSRKKSHSIESGLAALLLLCASNSTAEFYIWADPDGVRHVSTHPKSCFEDGRIDTLRSGCKPWRPSAEQAREFELKRRRAEVEKRDAAFAEECAAIRANRDRLSKGIRNSQIEFNSRVIGSAVGTGALDMGLKEIINLPIKLKSMQEEMLAADKDYDKCFPESEREKRKLARNEIRRRSAENAQRAQQQNLLRGIQNDLRGIKTELGLY